MTYLVLGLIVFIGTHSVRIVADGWRAAAIGRMGALPWKAVYALLSIAGFALMLWGFGQARHDTQRLWTPPAWGRPAAGVLMLASMVLIVGYFFKRSHISTAVHHPMLWSVVLWGAAHLLANGKPADVALFGALLAWGCADLWSCYARDRAAGTAYPPGAWPVTAANVALGLAAWVGVVLWFHPVVIGVRLMPAG